MVENDPIILNLDLQQVLTPEQAWHYSIVPKDDAGSTLGFYIDELKPMNGLVEELEILLGKNVILEKAPSLTIQKALGQYYRRKKSEDDRRVKYISTQSDNFVDVLISEARELGSSDIHIEAYEDRCRIRFRIDGLLVERFVISRNDYPSLVNKIKIQSNLDIAEKRLPQDGRILLSHEGKKMDLRVSVLPSLHGEKIVLRLLSRDNIDISIDSLGFGEVELKNYLEGIKRPNGIVLISGPTGSGKTTTLYATLKILNKTTNNILTIEDPIEYTLEGINQVQLKESIGLTFASALRTFLRQDPDIIMLGEIRDDATAGMAIRASLTGHLVLSTIHTKSAWGSVSRLINFGVPSYLVADTLNTTVAQRLLRLLCPHCKEIKAFSCESFPRNWKSPRELREHAVAVGCDQCHHTGYLGRKAIYEVIPIDQELSIQIRDQNLNIESQLLERGLKSLADNAFELFENLSTTLEEVYPLLLNSR